MPIVFKAKTDQGHQFKILSELLQNNIKLACFEIDESGIRLRTMGENQTILIDLDLKSDHFSIFNFKLDAPLIMGIQVAFFYRMVKNVKKKDSIELFIDSEHMSELGIKIIPKEGDRITTSTVKIQNIQNISIELEDEYKKPVIVKSTDFQKLCKEITISSTTQITTCGSLIKFTVNSGEVMKRCSEFGERDEDDDESEQYEEDFETEKLIKIAKLSGFSSNINIYSKNGYPLMFKSAIGTLGEIKIYIKSKNLQEIESHSVEEKEEVVKEDEYVPLVSKSKSRRK